MSSNTAASTSVADAAALAAVNATLAHAQGASGNPSTTGATRNTNPEPRDDTVVLPSPAGNTVAIAAPPRVANSTLDARGFIERELILVKGNREIRKAIIQHIATQLSIQVVADKSLADTMRSALLTFDQRPADFTLTRP